MKALISWIALLSSIVLSAQPFTEVKETPLTLKERYQKMKTSSETYTEYKVIRENLLDKTWQIFNDSLQAGRIAQRQVKAEVTRLENELADLKQQWKAKEEAANAMEFAGTHISFLGLDFGKKTFISIVLIILCALMALSGLLTIQMKSMYRYQHERSEVLDTMSREFDEYKKKTLEKQTKLSRELQNERNRVTEQRKV